MRIRSHAGLLAALGLSVGGLTALALSISAGAASGQVCVGVVVQDGSSATPSVQAAEVDPGTSDLQAMSAAGDVPTQNNSGLVCAINDYPPDGLDNCLMAKAGKFFYWSYWQGNPDTNTWTYASVGPASHDVSAGTDYVEGWRYQDPGADNPTAPSPTMTPAAAFAQATAACLATTTPTTSGGGGGSSGGGGGSTPAPSTAPTTAPRTQPTAAPSGILPGASGPGSTTTTNPKGSAGTAPPSAPPSITTVSGSVTKGNMTVTVSSSAGFAANDAVSDTAGAIPANTVISSVPAGGTSIVVSKKPTANAASDFISVVTNRAGLLGLTAGSTTTSSTGVGAGSHSKTRASPTTLAEADASAHGQSGGEPVLPIIVVAVLVLLLGGVSWFRWRRRPAEE